MVRTGAGIPDGNIFLMQTHTHWFEEKLVHPTCDQVYVYIFTYRYCGWVWAIYSRYTKYL